MEASWVRPFSCVLVNHYISGAQILQFKDVCKFTAPRKYHRINKAKLLLDSKAQNVWLTDDFSFCKYRLFHSSSAVPSNKGAMFWTEKWHVKISLFWRILFEIFVGSPFHWENKKKTFVSEVRVRHCSISHAKSMSGSLHSFCEAVFGTKRVLSCVLKGKKDFVCNICSLVCF